MEYRNFFVKDFVFINLVTLGKQASSHNVFHDHHDSYIDWSEFLVDKNNQNQKKNLVSGALVEDVALKH